MNGATPEVSAPAATTIPEPSAFGWATLIVACVVTSMVSIGVSSWLSRDSANLNKQHLVFIDARRLIDAKALELTNKGMSNEHAAKEGTKFATSLQSVVADYQAKGFTVVNGAALLSDTDDNDLTGDVARRLGVQFDSKGVVEAPKTNSEMLQ